MYGHQVFAFDGHQVFAVHAPYGHPFGGHPFGHAVGVAQCRYCGVASHSRQHVMSPGTHHDCDCPRFTQQSSRQSSSAGGRILSSNDLFDLRAESSGSYTDLGTRTLYHATSASAARSILSGGFRCGSSGCVGGGIYFADSPSAARHKSRNGSEVVLQADVYLGNAYTIRNGVSRRDADSVDRSGSVYLPNGAGGGGADAEYAVFSSSRVSDVSRA